MIRKIEVVLLESTPSGLRYYDVVGSSLRAYVFPRSSLSDFNKREESKKPGIYLLFGQGPDDVLPRVYAGEAEMIGKRLQQHKEDFWTESIAFISKDNLLNKALVKYLENILIDKINSDKLCLPENGVSTKQPSITEGDQMVMGDFLDQILVLMSVIGKNIIGNKAESSQTLYCQAKDLGITGESSYSDEGVLVHKGSTVRKESVPSLGIYTQNLRKKLIETGVLVECGVNYIFFQDYLFKDPSTSSSLILGRPSNGRVDWKDKNGKTLKELQEEK